MRITGVVFAGLMAVSATGVRADDMTLQSIDGTVTFTGSYGLTSIRANELVYEGSRKVSQLIWESSMIHTLNGSVTVELPKDFYIRAGGTIGLDGNGHMVDYDWLLPGNSWSDRSIHPDTRLNHYFVANIEIGRAFAVRDGTEIGLGAGFRYTDVKWAAWGGSFVYSDLGFRDWRGRFDPNEKSISYRQSWPVPYLGASVNHTAGAWTFTGALSGGLAIDAYGTDDHWARSLRFYDYFETTPTVTVSGAIDYAVWNNASLYLSGSLDKAFRARADTKAVDTTTGEEFWFRDGAGGDYRSATVSFGLKGRF